MPEDNDFPKSIYHRYQAYLLRIWQERPHMLWRASLQDSISDERISFLDLDSLFAYLRQQSRTSARTDEAETRSPPELE